MHMSSVDPSVLIPAAPKLGGLGQVGRKTLPAMQMSSPMELIAGDTYPISQLTYSSPAERSETYSSPAVDPLGEALAAEAITAGAVPITEMQPGETVVGGDLGVNGSTLGWLSILALGTSGALLFSRAALRNSPLKAQVSPSAGDDAEVVPAETTSSSDLYLRASMISAGALVCWALFFMSQSGVAAAIATQVVYEVTHCTASSAKFFGFCGACCNWFLGLSAISDAKRLGPEVISLPTTLVMLAYSTIFARWAGWAVMPANYILAGSHMLNIAAQSNQLRRCINHKLETEPNAKAEIAKLGTQVAGALAAVAGFVLAAPWLRSLMPVGSYLASSGGPFTIHPWPPVTKFFISLTSLTDIWKPVEKISLAQFSALTLTGFIFTFYGLLVTPINYPLTGVNILLFFSSGWHLVRKLKSCF